MAIETSITVNFSDKESVSGLRDMLIINQEGWVNNTGKVRVSDFYNFSYNYLTAQTYENSINCGLDSGGNCTSIIYAYPRVANLSYQLNASFGELSGRNVDSYEHQELIAFDIAKKSDTQFTPSGNVSYSWVGSVYDSFGNIMPPPNVTIDSDGHISLSSKVYGSLKLVYTTIRHTYTLKVTPRSDGTDLFGAVVYGVYDQGISWLELDNPLDVDEIASGTLLCGGMPPSVIVDDDLEDEGGGSPTSAPKVNRVITTDYCTQEVMSDLITYT